MSIDYCFYNKNYINRNINKINDCYFIEGYHLRVAIWFCEIMKLPELPVYFCYKNDEPYQFKTDLWFKRLNLPNYYNNFILTKSYINKKTAIQRYKYYEKWKNYYLKNLNSLTIKDIKEKIKGNEDINFILNNGLNEIKKDINKFLWFYKNHYYCCCV